MCESEALAWVLLMLMTVYMLIWQRRYIKLQARFSSYMETLINTVQVRVTESHTEMVEQLNELSDESQSSSGSARSQEAWRARESRERQRDLPEE